MKNSSHTIEIDFENHKIKYNRLIVNLVNLFLDLKTKGSEGVIFTVSTGRCGTQSLANIFGLFDEFASYHEPYPIMLNYFPDQGLVRNQLFLKQVWSRIKRINIKRNLIDKRYYFESNFNFLPNFNILAIKEFDNKIRIMEVLRDPLKVAKSFYKIGVHPGTDFSSNQWILSTDRPDNVIQISKFIKKIDDPESMILSHLLWYCYEKSARAIEMRQNFPSLVWSRIRTRNLNNIHEIERVCNELKIKVTPSKLHEIERIHCNKKEHKKRFYNLSIDHHRLEYLNNELLKYIGDNYSKNFIDSLLEYIYK